MTVCLQFVDDSIHCWSVLLTQEKIEGLRRDLEKAQKVVAEQETLETVLRQRVHELEDDNKDLMVTSYLVSILWFR